MCKLKIDLEQHKAFFHSPSGEEFIKQIIKSDNLDMKKELVGWNNCPTTALDAVAIKYMLLTDDEDCIKTCFYMLEAVVRNPKISSKTLGDVLDYTTAFVKDYRYICTDTLHGIASSKKITDDIAIKLYKLLMENQMANVVDTLSRNRKTPDEILFDMIEEFSSHHNANNNASDQIVERYKKLKKVQGSTDN